jgi:hypothetical protein
MEEFVCSPDLRKQFVMLALGSVMKQLSVSIYDYQNVFVCVTKSTTGQEKRLKE